MQDMRSHHINVVCALQKYWLKLCFVPTGLAMDELQRKVDKYESALKQLIPKLDEMKKERDDMKKERDDMKA